MVVGEAERGHAGDKWMSSLWIMYMGSCWFLEGWDQNCLKPGGFKQELAHAYMLSVLNGDINGSKALLWYLV